ncbi:MAG: DMT family transporter [Deltaproteobacteria bacterium]|nr:DMT family transporter [Deltaproteobacteria bacterium]
MKSLSINHSQLGRLALVGSALAYSFEWLFMRNLMSVGFSPLAVVFSNSLLPLTEILFLSCFVPILKYRLSKQEHKIMFAYSVINLGMAGCFTAALKHTTVANAVFFNFLSPIWIAIFGYLFLSERFTLVRWSGLILTCGGVFFIFTGSSSKSINFNKGDLFAMAAGMLMAIGIILLRKSKTVPALKKMVWIYTFRTIAIGGYLVIFPPLINWQSANIIIVNVILLATCISLLPAFLKNYGINHTDANVASIIMMTEVVGQVATAWLVGGEVPTDFVVFGGGLIVCASGLVIMERRILSYLLPLKQAVY